MTPRGEEEDIEGRQLMAKRRDQHLLYIHRCRFLDWEPRAIVCMAACASGRMLAVARESGEVEIRLVDEKFRVAGVVPVPGGNGLIRSMTWSRQVSESQGRLFVGSLDTSVFEIDVPGLRVRRRQDSYGGPVWCLAADPHRDLLAVGCEDGSVKLFSTADQGFEFSRALPTVNSRILSMAWQAPPSPRDSPSLFVGAVDGTIRHLDARTGHSAYRMTVEAKNSAHPPLVWSLLALSDGTLVSGDSLGAVHFWDGAMGALKQSFWVHEADVLALAASAAGDTVFASGVDSKLVCLRRPSQAGAREPPGAPEDEAWVLAASNRAHSHDLRALAVVERSGGRGGEGRRSSLLVSGGVDTKLCTYSVASFAHNRPRYIAPYPYYPVASVASARGRRLLMMQHSRKLQLWGLGGFQEETALCLQHEPSPLLEIQAVKGQLIVSSSLSPDGRFLAYATTGTLRVLALEVGESEGGGAEVDRGGDGHARPRVLLRRNKLPALAGRGGEKDVKALCFSPDSRSLVVGTGGGRVLRAGLKGSLVEEAIRDTSLESEEGQGVVRLSCSQDGRLLAVGRWNGDVELYAVPASSSGEDTGSLSLTWRLPRLDSAPTALAFHPETDILVVACVSNRFYVFDAAGQRLTDWSQDMGHRLPRELLDRHDCIVGVCFNPDSPQAVVLYGFGFVCYVDLGRPPGQLVQILPASHPAALAQRASTRKRQHEWLPTRKQKKQRGEAEIAQVSSNKVIQAIEDNDMGGTHGRRKSRGDSLVQEAEERSLPPGSDVSEQLNGKMVKEDDGNDSWNFKMHLGYQGVVAVEALGPDELLLVEEPWIKIVSKLPDVLHRHRYGT